MTVRTLGTWLCAALLLFPAAACDSGSDGKYPSVEVIMKSDCADHLRYRIEQPSFATSPAGKFTPARLEQLRLRAGDAFTSIADQLCAKGELDPGALSGVREVRIETAAGTTESAVYDDPETGPETLFFQYSFAESDLALPDKADIEAGIRCWKQPGRPECEGRGG